MQTRHIVTILTISSVYNAIGIFKAHIYQKVLFFWFDVIFFLSELIVFFLLNFGDFFLKLNK